MAIIFSYKKGDTHYVFPHVYSWLEFESIMGRVEEQLPIGIYAHYIESDVEYEDEHIDDYEDCILDNLLLQDCFSLEPELLLEDLLFSEGASGRLKPKNGKPVKLIKQFRDLAIVESDLGMELTHIPSCGYKYIVDMEIIPISFRQAAAYVNSHHRHNVAPQGHKFSIGLIRKDTSELIGVAIASNPKARMLDDGRTLDINRVCVDSNYADACSMLYGAALRVGKDMGYKRFYTYTLPSESGSSLKAAGFIIDGITRETPKGWNTGSRHRKMALRYPTEKKIRWKLQLTDNKGQKIS